MFGANEDLPEGVFGVIDDLTPLFQLETLHPSPWDKKSKPKKVKKRKRKAKHRAEHEDDRIRMPQLDINPELYEELPKLQYENTVDVPEELLKAVTRKSTQRTKDFSQLMMSRILPTIMGLEAAQSFVTTAMRDGLNIELEMDNSIMEGVKNLTNLDLMFYFVRRSSLPQEYKKQFLRTVVDETAKLSVQQMATASAHKDKTKQMAALQSVLVRGMSSAHRQEDRARRQPSGEQRSRPQQQDRGQNINESIIGLVDSVDTRGPRSELGSMKRKNK